MDYGSIDLAGLAEAMGGHSAFIRAAVEQRDQWALRTCHVVVGRQPPGWLPVVWEYEGVLLIACEMPADQLMRAFGPDGGTLELASRLVGVPAAHDLVNFRREPSRVRHDMAPLPWPSTDFTVSAQTPSTGQDPQGLLIGADGSPSFPDYLTAVQAFIYGRTVIGGARSLPSELARIRRVETAAWLERVHVAQSRIAVRVRGDDYAGARVELNGETTRASKIVGTTGAVTLRLPNGLPDDAWLYLSRGKRWLDYRVLGPRLVGRSLAGDPEGSGVTVEIPDESNSRAQAFVVSGEGPYVEFKRMFPETTVESKRKVLKTVAAFANGGGGTIVFGVDPDELTLTGIDGAGDPGVRDRLGNLIRATVVPTPDFKVDTAALDGKDLMILSVPAGASKPYGLQFGGKPVEFYVRRGASTYPATQAEIRAAALSTVPPPEAAVIPWRR